jgi:hypothetical protein
MEGFFRTYSDTNLQAQMDAAVVIPTVLRPSLRQALESIFAQAFSGRIHVLIGIDQMAADMAMIDQICASRPSHCAVQVFWPGYSTAVRHGGLMPPGDGGALRAILSYLANSPYVAYLDDDNWWAPTHLSDLRQAIDKADWAFSLRWYVHPFSRRPICVDVWESVGPSQGLYNKAFGGFVDPSSLMINKLVCPSAPQNWNFASKEDPMGADRYVFDCLSRHHRACGTGQPTSFYTLNPNDPLHSLRVQYIGRAYDEAGKIRAW